MSAVIVKNNIDSELRIKHGDNVGALNITTGLGSPEGNITSNIGSMYLRADGGAGSTLYIKESGAGNTGWVAK